MWRGRQFGDNEGASIAGGELVGPGVGDHGEAAWTEHQGVGGG